MEPVKRDGFPLGWWEDDDGDFIQDSRVKFRSAVVGPRNGRVDQAIDPWLTRRSPDKYRALASTFSDRGPRAYVEFDDPLTAIMWIEIEAANRG